MLKNFKTFMLSVSFYKACKKLKLNRVLYDQLLRASSSICLNLAEGYGRATHKDKRKFYYISMGSLRECEAVLIMEDISDEALLENFDHLARSLYNLLNNVSQKDHHTSK